MTALSLFGLFAVTAMLVCYAFEDRSRWFILAFAVACWLGSAYGFLQGAWPFGAGRGRVGCRCRSPLVADAIRPSFLWRVHRFTWCSRLSAAPRDVNAFE